MGIQSIEIAREELYRVVWETPMRTLASQYGVSDVGLAKVCRRYNIPRPPAGYRAKKQFGKAGKRVPLPHSDDPELAIARFYAEHARNPELQHDGATKPSYLANFFDPELRDLAAKEISSPTLVTIPTALRSPHPLVVRTREGLAASAKDKHYGRYSDVLYPRRVDDLPCLSVNVSKSLIDRSMRIMDGLIKAMPGLGAEFIEPKRRADSTAFKAFGHEFSLRLREPTVRTPHELTASEKETLKKYPGVSWIDKWDCVPSGQLVLEFYLDDRYSVVATLRDGKTKSLEEQLSRLRLTLIKVIDALRRDEARWAEEARQRAEIERLRCEEEDRRRQEQERRRKEEERAAALIEHSECWHQANRLREFIGYIQEQAILKHGSIETDSELDQ